MCVQLAKNGSVQIFHTCVHIGLWFLFWDLLFVCDFSAATTPGRSAIPTPNGRTGRTKSRIGVSQSQREYQLGQIFARIPGVRHEKFEDFLFEFRLFYLAYCRKSAQVRFCSTCSTLCKSAQVRFCSTWSTLCKSAQVRFCSTCSTLCKSVSNSVGFERNRWFENSKFTCTCTSVCSDCLCFQP